MSSCFRRREHRKIEPLRLRGWPGVTPSMMGGAVDVCFWSLSANNGRNWNEHNCGLSRGVEAWSRATVAPDPEWG